MSVEDMTPQQMLDAAMDGSLSLDGEQQETINTPTDEQAEQTAKLDAPNQEAQAADEAQADDEPEGAPIASKSGAYTIPYEKLAQAREKAQTLAAENEALKAQLEELNTQQQQNLAQAQAQAQGRADAGESATQADQNLETAQEAIEQGADVEVFGDFSEEAIAKGIATLQAREREAIRAELKTELKAEIEKELAPIRQSRQQQARDDHYGAIYAKHPDADELAQSEQFAQWQQGLPAFMREGINKALSEGTTEQVIEVFDTFKSQTETKQPKQPQAKASMDVQRHVPTSLSEIAGEPHRDLVQQTLEQADNPAALMNAMQSMTPEQLDRVLNAV